MPISGFPKDTPKEINDFIVGLFELYEIRARVSERNGISFNIYTHDHNPPHVHIKYAEYEIKVSLVDFSVIKGNLPRNKQKEAIAWVKKNQEKMLNEWTKYTNLDGMAVLMKSRLDQ